MVEIVQYSTALKLSISGAVPLRPRLSPSRAMTFFANSRDVQINGGNFYDVAGSVNIEQLFNSLAIQDNQQHFEQQLVGSQDDSLSVLLPSVGQSSTSREPAYGLHRTVRDTEGARYAPYGADASVRPQIFSESDRYVKSPTEIVSQNGAAETWACYPSADDPSTDISIPPSWYPSIPYPSPERLEPFRARRSTAGADIGSHMAFHARNPQQPFMAAHSWPILSNPAAKVKQVRCSLIERCHW
jgi:hypothetical protein